MGSSRELIKGRSFKLWCVRNIYRTTTNTRNLVSMEFHLFKWDLTFISLCWICNKFHINRNYTIHIYKI
ncbi:hypothetical protein Gotri_012645 [Gossypium trilobum]|uniref:Uncharacterized protein n=1 Tax=Gossypium trilobum TaxID=34281 RepID=A0A7J9DR03_9ROSI|nr:hypothetical protein [Gossypium trilobum]